MGGTTKQAASPDNVSDALKAMTAARDQAALDLAAAVAERDEAQATIATLTGERDLARADLARISGERDAAGVSATAVIRSMIKNDFQPKDEGEWDVDARTIELLDQFAGIRDRLIGVNGELAELGLLPEGPVEPVEFAAMVAQRFREIAAERDQAVADLATATTGLTRVKADLKTARASLAPKPAKLRAIGPVSVPQPAGEALLAAIADAETVELAFSDGSRELGSMPPMLIQGNAWHLAVNGVKLRIGTLPVHGLGQGEPSIRLAGFGLLLDGKLAAYAPRMDVLELQPGSRHELKDDVIFA